MTKCALFLRSLLKQKRRAALWASFEDRLVPVNPVAIRIGTAAIEQFSAFRLLDHELAFTAGPRTLNTCRFLLDVFTLGIV